MNDDITEAYVEMRKLKPLSDMITNETIVKQNRNSKCLCGSGRKYKNCCLKDMRETQKLEHQRKIVEKAVDLGIITINDQGFVEEIPDSNNSK